MGRLTRLVPGLEQVRTYQRRWFVHDVTAGVVLTGLLAPAGMAYATASGLPAVTDVDGGEASELGRRGVVDLQRGDPVVVHVHHGARDPGRP